MKIFVTGANRGLGLELTRVGVERGHIILAGVRNPDKAQELSQLQSEFPELIHIYSLDVAKEDSIGEASKKVKGDFECLDVLINNAGILLSRDKKIEELDFDEMQTTLDVNLLGPMKMTKYFLPLLHQGKNQSIIHISSEAGSFHNAYGGDYPYAISKSALNMFTEQLKNYLKDKEIPVYAIHPGWIKTDMGGDQAPGSPYETANGILDIVERKVKVEGEFSFIDYKGNPMPI